MCVWTEWRDGGGAKIPNHPLGRLSPDMPRLGGGWIWLAVCPFYLLQVYYILVVQGKGRRRGILLLFSLSRSWFLSDECIFWNPDPLRRGKRERETTTPARPAPFLQSAGRILAILNSAITRATGSRAFLSILYIVQHMCFYFALHSTTYYYICST